MFSLCIKTENAAFGESPDEARAEVARILREVIETLRNGSPNRGGLYDANGNRVGAFTVTGKART